MRVLVVDDQRVWRETIEKALSSPKYEVVTTDNRLKAIDLAKTGFDVIIVDFRFEGQDHDEGKLLLGDLIDMGIQTPCIVLTQYSHRAIRLRQDYPNVVEYLSKSNVNLVELRDAVDEAGNTPLRSDTMVGCQKILVLAAMPPSLTRVRCDMEIEKLRELTLEPGHSQQLEINTLLVVKGSNIGKALLAERPKYVHFCGHGASEGEIFFEDENGQAMPVVAGALSKLFEEFRETVSCVVLNACYSEEQAKAISKTIDYVIGVPNQIDESAAMLFSVAFYRAIAFGKEVTGAFRQAKAELAIITSEDPPVLYARGAKVVG